LAARHSQTDIAALLINQGADVNGRVEFDNRKAPLHWAGHFGNGTVVVGEFTQFVGLFKVPLGIGDCFRFVTCK
jgi:ankyrin repeat protein